MHRLEERELHTCSVLETSYLSDLPRFLTGVLLDALASGQANQPEKPLLEYAERPQDFFRDAFRVELWEMQQEILRQLYGDPDDPDIPEGGWSEVWVAAAHGVGKTFLAALLGEHHFSCRGKPVLTTAPTTHQVENLLWGQGIRTNRIKSLIPLPGRVLTKEIKTCRPDWWARGFSTDKPERAQGVHLDDLLIIVDEGAGVETPIYGALKGYFTNKGVKMLVIGNPSANRANEFYKAFHERRGQVGLVNISAIGCPHVPDEWVEARRREWGADSIEYITKVLGQFPSDASDKCIPMPSIEAAGELWDHPEVVARRTGVFSAVALDVAREGADKCALVGLDGQSLVVLKYWDEPSTTKTAGQTFHIVRALPSKPKFVIVDANAVGGGVVDTLRDLWAEHTREMEGCTLLALDWSSSASKPLEYHRKIDELFWRFRQALNPNAPLEDRLALPPDELLRPHGLSFGKLASQLNARRYEINERGRIKVESKKELLKRKGGSPDVADAMVALLHRPDREEVGFLLL